MSTNTGNNIFIALVYTVCCHEHDKSYLHLFLFSFGVYSLYLSVDDQHFSVTENNLASYHWQNFTITNNYPFFIGPVCSKSFITKFEDIALGSGTL